MGAKFDGLDAFRDELIAVVYEYPKGCDDTLLELASVRAAERRNSFEVSEWFLEHDKIR